MASEPAATVPINTPLAIVGLGVGHMRAEVAYAEQPAAAEVVEEMQSGCRRLVTGVTHVAFECSRCLSCVNAE